ncbi:MAG: leucine-rich repeat protein [Rikenellaceae bacterium]
MRSFIHISLCMVVTLLCGCKNFEEQATSDSTGLSIVEIMDDGQMRVMGTLSSSDMLSVSVSSRADLSVESNFIDGWCLVFGEDETYRADADKNEYTNGSPLLLKKKLTINANGTFFVTLPCYSGVAFLRVVTNLTTRENDNLSGAIAWGDDEENYSTFNEVLWLNDLPADDDDLSANIATFEDYKYQSVGLDGIYDIEYNVKTSGYEYDTTTGEIVGLTYDSENENVPDIEDTSLAFPMSSIGFAMEDGINEDSIVEMFGTTIYMVRVCSKADVTVADSDFKLYEVYMLDCAQESRVRSTVLSDSSSNSSTTLNSTFGVPKDLGGTITYGGAMASTVGYNETTSPIYFYPNAGAYYDSNNGAVSQSTNPQYLVIKGRAGGYDTDGYYKIALKAQYPLTYLYADEAKTILATDSDGNYIAETWSDVTYEILRNVYFKVQLTMVDKPGYKTLEDAMDENNPASNISYSITIFSSDGRNEILVSNGTYYVELNTTRVYMKGYDSDDGNRGSITFNVCPNSASVTDGDYYHPAIYVMSDFKVAVESVYANGVSIDKVDNTSADFVDGADSDVQDYWFKVESSSINTEVTVNYIATNSGRIRLRIGDMLKFIPVVFEEGAFTGAEQPLDIGYEDDFSYDDIDYLSLSTGSLYDIVDSSSSIDWFTEDGEIKQNDTGAERELRAMIYPKAADGVTKVYIKQAKYTSAIINSDAYDPGSLTELRDGNVIYTNGTNGESYTNAADAAAQIITMLENGYTTIYFEGDIDSMSSYLSIAAIMDVLEGTDYTFAVDLSKMEGFDEDYGGKDEGSYKNFYENLFDDNDNITSIVLPAEVKKIKENTFNNCSNLKVVIIASVDEPSTLFEEVIENAFDGCDKLETIIVYSRAEKVIVDVQDTDTNCFTVKKEIQDSAAKSIIVYTANSSGTITGTSTSDNGYFYIFGDTDDYMETDGKDYIKTYYSYTKTSD